MKINSCTGCYTCWTKTPGECIFQDDMTDLRLKFRKADLVVFASPLYVYNVTGIMKNFLDRNVPNLKPYMLIENGITRHPHRYPEERQQGFVVFSAAGFPEVDHNFDGLKGMFRCLHSHSEQASLMGEVYPKINALFSTSPIWSLGIRYGTFGHNFFLCFCITDFYTMSPQ